MSKEEKVEFDTQAYDLWMKKSKEFFASAEKNFKEMLDQDQFHAEKHLKTIQEWLDTMKVQWDSSQLPKDQTIYHHYWQMMANMCHDAAKYMIQEWTKRVDEHHPIKDIHELSELWLSCCHHAYQDALQTKTYQEAYDFMHAATNFWKSVMIMPK